MESENKLDLIKKRRSAFCEQLVRINPNRLRKTILHHFNKNFNLKHQPDNSFKKITEINFKNEEIIDQHIPRNKIKEYREKIRQNNSDETGKTQS